MYGMTTAMLWNQSFCLMRTTPKRLQRRNSRCTTLPAFRKTHKTLQSVQGDTFLTWLYVLDRGYRDTKEMEVLSAMTEGLRNFAARYNYAINDPELIRRYRMVEDGKRDVATRISVAEKRGEERGERNAKYEVARNLKEKGIAVEVISEVTGVSVADVNAL